MSIYVIFPVLAALCWGFAQVVGKKCVQTIPINTFNSIREVMAAALAVSLIFVMRKGDFSFISFQNINLILSAVGVVFVGNVLTLIFLYKAMQKGSVNIVTIALCSSPMFVFIYSYFFFDETITPRLILGMILILAAIALLSRVRKVNKADHKNEVVIPIVLATLSGACQSVLIVGNKILVRKMDIYDLNFIEVVATLIMFLILSGKGILRIFDAKHVKGTHLAVLSGVVGRALGCLLLFIGIKYVDTIVVSPISNSSMFFAIFFGAILLKEKLRPIHIVASLLAFAGALLIILRTAIFW